MRIQSRNTDWEALKKMVLWKIFGPKMDEMVAGWRRLLNEEFRNMYRSPIIIRIITKSMMIWAGHSACMGRTGKRLRFW
jgi:hypothetical protein